MRKLPTQTATVVILIVGFYLLLPFSQPSKNVADEQDFVRESTLVSTEYPGAQSEQASDKLTEANTTTAVQASVSSQNNKVDPSTVYVITVFGTVTDENNQPIEDALISDEFKFGNVRTDQNGHYQITLEKSKFKTPFLNFLRSGYREDRIGIPVDNSMNQSKYELNVTLKEAANSTSVHGWLGNELGIGLAGHKIEIRTKSIEDAGVIFYAVISDENGDFSFEGIRSDLAYKLKVEPTQVYAGYTLEPYSVTQNTPPTTIILDALKLVNVDGMIVDTNNSPVPNFEINVQNTSLDFPDRKIKSDSSGFFKLESFPAGVLKLSTNAPEYFKITGLELREDEYRNLTLAIDKGSYHLSGWISDENGAPLEKARVIISTTFTNEGYNSYSYRSVKTDSSGGFEFSQLGGQSHMLSVYANGFDTHVRTHRFSSFSDQIQISLSR